MPEETVQEDQQADGIAQRQWEEEAETVTLTGKLQESIKQAEGVWTQNKIARTGKAQAWARVGDIEGTAPTRKVQASPDRLEGGWKASWSD